MSKDVTDRTPQELLDNLEEMHSKCMSELAQMERDRYPKDFWDILKGIFIGWPAIPEHSSVFGETACKLILEITQENNCKKIASQIDCLESSLRVCSQQNETYDCDVIGKYNDCLEGCSF